MFQKTICLWCQKDIAEAICQYCHPSDEVLKLNFRGRGNLNGDRFEIPFFTIGSETFIKQEQELMASKMPIIKLIESNAVLDLQRQIDNEFIYSFKNLYMV